MEEKDNSLLNSEGVLDSEGQLIPASVEDQLHTIADMAIAERDPNKVKDLTQLFASTMNKKLMIRMMKFNDLIDLAGDQAIERFDKRPDNFSNKELLDYLNVVSTINDKNMTQLKEVSNAPVVNSAVQHNEVNINMGDKDLNNLPRESRERILDYINSVLKTGSEIVDVEVESKGEKDE